MNVALTTSGEAVLTDSLIRQESEGETFPVGSLKHLYSKAENAAEARLAMSLSRVLLRSESEARLDSAKVRLSS
ncbi:MAG: hypothetical protein JNM65_12795 [Verrucomicrobiaceae bacterium]|nr:hypothetical protein [Verrucomicrobiaceae bacterium]